MDFIPKKNLSQRKGVKKPSWRTTDLRADQQSLRRAAGPSGDRNWTRDEGGPSEFGNQVLISNHRKLLGQRPRVVNVPEKSQQDLDKCD
jgi:hypothetical protein